MQKYFTEARSLLALGIPIFLAQFSQTAMGFVDTIMAGSVSETEMSAVAVGFSIWLPAILFGQGLLMALTPIIAQMNGSGRRNLIGDQVQQGLWLAFLLSLGVMFLLYNSKIIIGNMPHIDPELADKSVRFLHAIMWGAPGYLFYQVYRSQCEGLSKTKPGMVIGFLGLMVNIPINYIFIYGHFGAPALGGVGCGVATASVYWVMCMLMRWYVKRAPAQRDIRATQSFASPNPIILKRIVVLGTPIGLALFFEVTLFAVVALLVAPLGVVAVAGHQVALNFSSVMFMFPLSLGIAATIRVGYNLGKQSTEAAKVSSYAGLAVGLMVACMTAILTAAFREPIAMMYNKNPEVVVLASSLMLYAAIYQLSDSVQVIGAGILRGYKDTRSIFFITFTAYWVLGLPAGYILALTDIVVPAMGPQGFWIGFIIGLSAAAIGMAARILWIHKQPESAILLKSTR
ncbi:MULTISPECIES: MATE family efflux transporter [Providencia]|uniref:Multidrug resistance protein MdtK n=1 Tax=Providencia heimbachae ATCC 35613 TaxID=1354272 RepID=A0A1B7K224_9GAMM|nr:MULTISPECIES: MATE family efflux transporter [Providencia]MBP6121126.1 MATE family efflux transporter [Providencia sp.]MDD9338365.1 MATE family efflux transporter [Providencia heimbachae]NIH22981.1 MATE family efflux transporter [Providencia heimbachae]OAT54188.1 multi antimicrobial extrusion (MATE) family protein [Providencia heimbachae ATCC 35613]QCJ70417.1 MATE family efflux transporter [Providencia heimbachae]